MDQIHESWRELFDQYVFDIYDLTSCDNKVFPKREDIFAVFQMNVKDIRVVLLGQDPYHKPGQAHGLSFSVPPTEPIPPSLRNIYKELQNEFPEREYTFSTGCLERWFHKEHIFLLNASLTVEQKKPGSHMSIWEDFTNDVIRYISEQNEHCVFLLLGAFAKSKQRFIQKKEKVVLGVHPSPLSAHQGFFHSSIFQKVEDILGSPIDWSN